MALDLTTYSDTELAALRSEVNAETVRRAQLRALPDQARQNAVEYMALGGDTDDLIAAINEATTRPPQTPAKDDSTARR
jgi:hypothetical protein